MTDRERAEFITVLISTGELYSKVPSDGALALYWQALRTLSLEQVKTGISRHIADPERGQYMPKPADILRWYQRARKPAILAWAEVEHAMGKIGSYQSVQFEDGVINAVVRDMGGWPWICVQDLDEPWTQKEFERRYEAYQSQGIQSHQKLIGYFEQDNSAKGLPAWVPRAILIGADGEQRLLEENVPEENEHAEHFAGLIGNIGKIQ